MGLWEFLQQWRRGRLVAGAACSILVHVLAVTALLWGLGPELAPRWRPKPGDDVLIVELPKSEERAAPGGPGAPPTPAKPAPRPAPPAPAPRVAAAPPPPEPARAPQPPRPTPKARPAPPAPRAPEPSAVQPAPLAPAPAPAEPAPRAEPGPDAPAPTPQPAQTETAHRPGPEPPAPAADARPERQVAALPPAGPATPSISDVRAALRAGAGGIGKGRGGILGDPVPLDSDDVRFSDYLDQVRRKIKEKWGFPCVKNPLTRECEVHSTSLEVEFGILRDGRVQFVEVVRFADYPIYDDYATNAIKLASPFPPVPAVVLKAMKAGSTGIPIRARFNYVVESSLTNLLR